MRYPKILSLWSVLFPAGCGDYLSPRAPSVPPPATACPECDSDGDRVPDKDDACPDVFAATHDGCPPQTVTGPIEIAYERDAGTADTDAVAGGNSGPSDHFLLVRAEQPFCPHLQQDSFKQWLIWQEGKNFFTGHFSSEKLAEGIQEIRPLGQNPDPNFTLCNIQKALAINSSDEVAYLWGEIREGNQLFLNVASEDRVWNLANFPLRHLGEERRDTVASLTALDNGQFLAVWTDANKVSVQKFSAEQGPLESPQIISRKETLLHVGNPDVVSADEGQLAFVWQEGTATYGNIVYARYDAETLELVQEENILDGTWPTVVSGESGTFIGWVGSDKMGHVLSQQGQWTFGGQFPLSPQLVASEQGHLLVFWSSLAGRDKEIVLFADVDGNQEQASLRHYAGQPVAEIFFKSRTALLSIMGSHLFVYAPRLIPNSLKIQRGPNG